MIALYLFIARFIYVLCSAFQQKSVIGDNYASIPITCFIRCACDYSCWGLVAYSVTRPVTSTTQVITEIFLMGIGATLGVFVGMKLHNKIYGEKSYVATKL